MGHSSHRCRAPLAFLLLVIIAILISFQTAAVASRLLQSPTREHGKINALQQVDPAGGVLEEEDSWNASLMGMEECEAGNEECLKRRVMYEAHLDYIYTQHHPKP